MIFDVGFDERGYTHIKLTERVKNFLIERKVHITV